MIRLSKPTLGHYAIRGAVRGRGCINRLHGLREHGGQPIPLVGEDRSSWEEALLRLVGPVALALRDGTLQGDLPLLPISIWGRRSDVAEAVARSFIGAALYLQGRSVGEITGLPSGERVDLAGVYGRAVLALTDPRSRSYLGDIRASQPLVENALLCIALMLTRHHLWDAYTDDERRQVATWIDSSARRRFNRSNWQWFKVMHLLFLEWAGRPIDDGALRECFAVIDSLYAGDGWYTDGDFESERTFDYYNAWTMHFCGLFFAAHAAKRWRAESDRFVERAARFMATYPAFFSMRAGHVLYGRSLQYRFATLAPFGPAIARGLVDDIAAAKAVCVATLNSYLSNGMVDAHNFVRAGLHGSFAAMTEEYSGAGSPYWCLLGFSPLLLPASHEFWHCRSQAPSVATATSLPTPGLVLAPQADGDVLLLNAGLSSDTYPYRYGKLAYSAACPMDYDEGWPVDNAVVVRTRAHDRWQPRRTVVSFEVGLDRCRVVWRPRVPGDCELTTELTAEEGGYYASHSWRSTSALEIACGGFVLPYERGLKRAVRPEGARVGDGDSLSAIDLVSGKAEARLVRRRGVNPSARVVEVPVLIGRIGVGVGEIAYRVTKPTTREMLSLRAGETDQEI
jgi:hypothetical protein